SAAPPHPTPRARRPPSHLRARTTTAKKVETGCKRMLTTTRLSSRYPNHCHPGTGTASRNCQAGTGATVSIMNRIRTACGEGRRLSLRALFAPSSTVDGRVRPLYQAKRAWKRVELGGIEP